MDTEEPVVSEAQDTVAPELEPELAAEPAELAEEPAELVEELEPSSRSQRRLAKWRKSLHRRNQREHV